VSIQRDDGEVSVVVGRLVSCPNGDVLVEIDGVAQPLSMTVLGDAVWTTPRAAAGDQQATHRVELQHQRGGRSGPTDSSLMALMTGRVVGVSCQVGEQVERGQVLVVVEAMKMEQPVVAPRDGLVIAVHCEVGELVERGVELVELAAEDD
jgi:biotin carboxyl carrier protein